MSDLMTFPKTVDEFMEGYKIVDTEEVYTNGTELVPIFRMKQWFEAHEAIPVEWIEARIDRLNKELREAKRHGQGQMIKWQEWELFGLKDMLKDWRAENEIT